MFYPSSPIGRANWRARSGLGAQAQGGGGDVALAGQPRPAGVALVDGGQYFLMLMMRRPDMFVELGAAGLGDIEVRAVGQPFDDIAHHRRAGNPAQFGVKLPVEQAIGLRPHVRGAIPASQRADLGRQQLELQAVLWRRAFRRQLANQPLAGGEQAEKIGDFL